MQIKLLFTFTFKYSISFSFPSHAPLGIFSTIRVLLISKLVFVKFRFTENLRMVNIDNGKRKKDILIWTHNSKEYGSRFASVVCPKSFLSPFRCPKEKNYWMCWIHRSVIGIISLIIINCTTAKMKYPCTPYHENLEEV